MEIPVIDIFAGPGGLGEGFSAFGYEEREKYFKICLSIEKEENAFNTLKLRSFFRKFPVGEVPEEYYKLQFDQKINNFTFKELFKQEQFSEIKSEIEKEVKQIELGSNEAKESKIDRLIADALQGEEYWILIGGPPCQAYSTVGRSRNKGNKEYDPEKDSRHFLYKEYLRILAKHLPPIFIMENVKGLLSSPINGKLIFPSMIEDLENPKKAVGSNGNKSRYRIFSFSKEPDYFTTDGFPKYKKPHDFIIESENYGIPQARHRVILLGIRDDIPVRQPGFLKKQNDKITVKDVLSGLPGLRSGLSRQKDSAKNWQAEIYNSSIESDWLADLSGSAEKAALRDCIVATLNEIKNDEPEFDRGGEVIKYNAQISDSKKELKSWYLDERSRRVFNHFSRSHMDSDLLRYLYASCYAKVKNISTQLRHFPKSLLPNHKNVNKAMGNANFSDRFRVQVENSPATTVMSHISKDGHYYIHFDPHQCRSLTVREAARLQTFPDNYIFTGPRTHQYVQVGNAVPPFLALQIAEIVYGVIEQVRS